MSPSKIGCHHYIAQIILVFAVRKIDRVLRSEICDRLTQS
jgi:hypothetical protein